MPRPAMQRLRLGATSMLCMRPFRLLLRQIHYLLKTLIVSASTEAITKNLPKLARAMRPNLERPPDLLLSLFSHCESGILLFYIQVLTAEVLRNQYKGIARETVHNLDKCAKFGGT